MNHGNPRLALRLFPVPADVGLSFSPQGRGGSRCGAWLLELSGAILVAAATLASAAAMTEQMTLRGTLKGHNGWVTQIATTPQFPDMILSASRGTGCMRGKTPCVLGTACLVAKQVTRVLSGLVHFPAQVLVGACRHQLGPQPGRLYT